MRRVLVVAIAALLGAGAWSTIALAAPAPSVTSAPATRRVAPVVEDAPVCPAEQIEAVDGTSVDGSTVVSFTLVDPRCGS